MKKLFFLIPFLLLLASCQEYGDKITQRITSNQGNWVVTVDSSYRAIGTVQVFDSAYIIQPSKLQRYAIAKKNGTVIWLYIFGVLGLASLAYSYYTTTSMPKWKGTPVAAGLAGIIFLVCAVAVIDWAVTKEAEIPKVTYDSLMKADGNLKAFWGQNLYK